MKIFNLLKRPNKIILVIIYPVTALLVVASMALMLKSFDGAMDISLANTLTGSAVSICAYSVAIYMIVKGVKTINKIKSENNNG